jgi:predicted nucleotidyltransferase
MENSLARLLAALEEYRPQKIILFGSAARGEADARATSISP